MAMLPHVQHLFAPGQEFALRHYAAIADVCDIPIVLQNARMGHSLALGSLREVVRAVPAVALCEGGERARYPPAQRGRERLGGRARRGLRRHRRHLPRRGARPRCGRDDARANRGRGDRPPARPLACRAPRGSRRDRRPAGSAPYPRVALQRQPGEGVCCGAAVSSAVLPRAHPRPCWMLSTRAQSTTRLLIWPICYLPGSVRRRAYPPRLASSRGRRGSSSGRSRPRDRFR